MKIGPPERWVLPNGLIVLYRMSPEVPLVAATVLLHAGSYYEDASRAGLASLTMDLLLSGTKRRNARQIADIIEFMGGSLGSQSSEDYSEMGFVAPVGQWTRVLDILADVLRNPSFPQKEIIKEKAQTLAALKSRHDTIFALAHDRFNKALFDRHPYGRPVDGFPETIVEFGREDFKAWHATQIRPDRTILSLVGPLPARRVYKEVDKMLGDWSRPKTDFVVAPRAPSFGPQSSHREEVKAKFEQAYLMTGVLAPAVYEDGYMALKVLNTLLGGGMSSRLFLQLREELGLAYEVSSFFPTRLHASQWVFYMGLPQERLPLAEKKMEEILRDLAKSGPTAREVAQAKQMIAGSFLMEHQTRRRQGWYSAWWEFLGKGQAYDNRFLKEIQSVSIRTIQTLAQRLLSQPRVTIVVRPK